MGKLTITKTYPDGTVETEEIDTVKAEKKDDGPKRKSTKGRKSTTRADSEAPQD